MIRDRTGWLRAAAAGAALLGIVVGVPLVLAVLVGWPLPTSMPNVEQVRAAGSDSLAWATVVKVLAVGAWAAWAHFTVCVLAEVRGELTGRHVSVPLGRVSQDLARRLVVAAFIATAVGGITPATAVTSAAASPPSNTVRHRWPRSPPPVHLRPPLPQVHRPGCGPPTADMSSRLGSPTTTAATTGVSRRTAGTPLPRRIGAGRTICGTSPWPTSATGCGGGRSSP